MTFLIAQGYKVRSINSMLAALMSLFHYLNWNDCRVKNIKLQKEIFALKEKELTKAEYQKLLMAAQEHETLKLILQTICSTGIRVSELKYFTVEAISKNKSTIEVSCKGKNRIIMIPGILLKALRRYIKKKKITTGHIFINEKGNPICRKSIWAQMKKLCKKANVSSQKVFPHNLRKLFARSFYKKERDIVKLADVLGHSSIETTRIYIMSTGKEHQRIVDHLDLIRDIDVT